MFGSLASLRTCRAVLLTTRWAFSAIIWSRVNGGTKLVRVPKLLMAVVPKEADEELPARLPDVIEVAEVEVMISTSVKWAKCEASHKWEGQRREKLRKCESLKQGTIWAQAHRPIHSCVEARECESPHGRLQRFFSHASMLAGSQSAWNVHLVWCLPFQNIRDLASLGQHLGQNLGHDGSQQHS